MRPSAVRDILKVSSEPGVISFAGGLPAAELFPVEEFRAAFAEALGDGGRTVLQYGVTEGYGPLREFLAARLASRGIAAATADRLLITSGAQQALDLIGKVFLDPGDTVAIEAPSYLGAIQAFDQYEADYLVVGSDDDGMNVEELAAALAGRRAGGLATPKFIYCLPNFQNPSGRTLSLERRERLLAVAREHRIPIVEDDPYGDLRYEGRALPGLRALDTDGLVVHLSSFSKILAPGLRLGWLLAPSDDLFRTMVLAKQPSDLHTACPTQIATHHLVHNGFLEGHIERLRACYGERRDAMAQALDGNLPRVGRTHPSGGLFLWAELPGPVDTSELLLEALREGVCFVPGESFHVDGGGRSSMRLNFATEPPEVIREGVDRLARVIGARLEPAAPAGQVAHP